MYKAGRNAGTEKAPEGAVVLHQKYTFVVCLTGDVYTNVNLD